jgi:hypothetical protein
MHEHVYGNHHYAYIITHVAITQFEVQLFTTVKLVSDNAISNYLKIQHENNNIA